VQTHGNDAGQKAKRIGREHTINSFSPHNAELFRLRLGIQKELIHAFMALDLHHDAMPAWE